MLFGLQAAAVNEPLLADNQTATSSGDAVVNFIRHVLQLVSVARHRATYLQPRDTRRCSELSREI